MSEVDEETQNPSMEEILKTIRGVISGEIAEEEDDSIAEATEEVLDLDETNEADEAEEDVLELTEEAVEEDPSPVDVLDNIDKALEEDDAEEPPVMELQEADEAVEAEPQIELPPEEEPVIEEPVVDESPAPEPEPSPEPIEEEPPVMQEATYSEPIAQQTISSLLTEDVKAQSSQMLQGLVNNVPRSGPHLRNGTLLEDLVIEALRPFLQDWLNKNLPNLVERIVEKEIQRLLPKEDD